MRFRWEQIVSVILSFLIILIGGFAIKEYLWETPYDPIALATMAPTAAPTLSPTPSPTPVSAAVPVLTASPTPSPSPSPTPVVATLTEDSYVAENVSIQMSTVRADNTTAHLALITLSDMSLLRAGLAKDSFGSNYREATSKMAERFGAVLAISGDYYSYNMNGIIVRNGTLYINEPKRQMCGIFIDGTMKIYDEADVNAEELLAQGLWQSYSFGPGLVIDGVVPDQFPAGVRKANPRCAIGMIEPGKFLFAAIDGRTEGNSGMTLQQLAEFMKTNGCVQAYNLDGGGSATMWFGSSLYNQPSGKSERDISDILYIPLDASLSTAE